MFSGTVQLLPHIIMANTEVALGLPCANLWVFLKIPLNPPYNALGWTDDLPRACACAGTLDNVRKTSDSGYAYAQTFPVSKLNCL